MIQLLDRDPCRRGGKQHKQNNARRHKQRVGQIPRRERQPRLQGCVQQGAAQTHFARACRDRRNAGRAGQQKDGERRSRGKAHGGGKVAPVKEGEHPRHVLLGDKPRERGERDAPVGDAHGAEEIFQPAAEDGEHALPAPRPDVDKGEREGEQQPHEHEKAEHRRRHLYYKLKQRKAQRSARKPQRGKLQGREFEDEGLLAARDAL